MAFATIQLEKPSTKEIRNAPVGFSWTTFFFGCIPALIRSDWKWALIMFIAAWVTVGLSWLVFPFIYNKLYINDLLNAGYQVRSLDGSTVERIEARIGRRLPIPNAQS